MEYNTGISIKSIFLYKGNWWKFFLTNQAGLRVAIIHNVIKMLACRTILLGFHQFFCPKCDTKKKVPHTCKSRFCSSCGKKATDKWVENKFATFPETKWQHITFTMPEIFWDFFWVNRYLLGKIPILAANIILEIAKEKGALPGIFLAIHTFGRDLKRNVHLHLTTTAGGISLYNQDLWIKDIYYHHETLKKQWRYAIINLLRTEYKNGNLCVPKKFKIKNYTQFNKLLNNEYNKKWTVHLQKKTNDQKRNIEYLGKYLKRPPLGETRITEFKDNNVTYNYYDHYTKQVGSETIPAQEFIGKLVSHIHDKHFRAIRYYGFLSNRLIGKLLKVVCKLVKSKNKKERSTTWRDLIIKEFGFDPLKCIKCGIQMLLEKINMPLKIPIKDLHEVIAKGLIT